VSARSLVEVLAVEPGAEPELSPPWEDVREAFSPGVRAPAGDAVEFEHASTYIALAPELAEFARASFTPRRPLLAAAVDLMHTIHREFRFDPSATTITTPVSRVLVERRGVCQDFAHLQISCLRSLGLPARYVSGYLLTDPPPGQPRLTGADASHAWLSVYCPRSGWVDLDPTNDVLPSVRHVTLAWGRDYGDVSPLRGVILGGAQHELEVGVSVVPLDPNTWQDALAAAR
jgi:transglutaminase-like putative cysteine protease